MSFQSKRELLQQVVPHYQVADSKEKTIMLDEFVAATDYGPDIQAALIVAWTLAKGICVKQLVPLLPELVQRWKRMAISP